MTFSMNVVINDQATDSQASLLASLNEFKVSDHSAPSYSPIRTRIHLEIIEYTHLYINQHIPWLNQEFVHI